MKYGESTFDILYLIFTITAGIRILRRAKSRGGRLMGIAALVLGCGDAFHLVPRVLNYFVQADFTAALGIGKLITSVTMTVFYVLLYEIWKEYYQESGSRRLSQALLALLGLRIAVCLFPQNGWLQNSSDVTWGILRNIPFVILGGIVCLLYRRTRGNADPGGDRSFLPMWILILLSFLFYLPVAVAAGLVPILGMLMLPKTVCYIWMVVLFLRAERAAG